MNWRRIEGDWNNVKVAVSEQWDLLSDDQLDRIGGKREQLVRCIQECHGMIREDAERQVMAWEMRYAFLEYR